jgi:hypothetical protein
MLNKNQAASRLGINDSAVVVVMKKGSRVWALVQVMEDYYIEREAYNFPIRTTYHHDLPAMKDFLVSPDMISGVGVSMFQDSYSIFISIRFAHLYDKLKPEIENPLRLIKKQYAMMP